MEMTSLAELLRRKETQYCGWSGLADPLSAEAIGRAGFDTVCLDQQHGFHDYDSIRTSIRALAAAGKPAIVRVPYDGYPEIGRALDLGAEGIICPMINNAADARRLADRVKFPPVGLRSWGPHGAMMLWGNTKDEYLAGANSRIVSFAMVETRESISNLDDILSTEGIDGVFLGPNDLSISLSGGAQGDPDLGDVWEAAKKIGAAARKHGKFAAAYANAPKFARGYVEAGFTLIAGGSDLVFVRTAAEAMLKSFREA